MEELLQRLVEIEQRLATLEAQAHSSHTILPEALESIAAHVSQRFNEHIRALFGKPATSDPQATEPVPANNAEEGK